MQVRIFGLDELNARLKALSDGLSDDSAQAAYLAAAQGIAAKARALAPRSDESKQPGQLRQAIRARVFRQGAVRRFGPGAYAQLQLNRTYRVNAWYGHIVESGRKDSVAGKGKVGSPKKYFSWVGLSGFRFFAKRVRGFSGRRFFERAVQSAGSQELERAADRLNALLKRKYDLG